MSSKADLNVTTLFEYLSDFTSWRFAVAAFLASIISFTEKLVGNPFLPEGRGLALVLFLVLMDAFFGILIALKMHTFRYAKLKAGLSKMLIWGSLMAISRQLSLSTGIVWADPALKLFSQYIIVQLIIIDLVSVLKHVTTASLVFGFATPGLDRLIKLIEQWYERPIHQSLQPLVLPPQSSQENKPS